MTNDTLEQLKSDLKTLQEERDTYKAVSDEQLKRIDESYGDRSVEGVLLDPTAMLRAKNEAIMKIDSKLSSLDMKITEKMLQIAQLESISTQSEYIDKKLNSLSEQQDSLNAELEKRDDALNLCTDQLVNEIEEKKEYQDESTICSYSLEACRKDAADMQIPIMFFIMGLATAGSILLIIKFVKWLGRRARKSS